MKVASQPCMITEEKSSMTWIRCARQTASSRAGNSRSAEAVVERGEEGGNRVDAVLVQADDGEIHIGSEHGRQGVEWKPGRIPARRRRVARRMKRDCVSHAREEPVMHE